MVCNIAKCRFLVLECGSADLVHSTPLLTMEGASLLKDDNDGLDPSLDTTQLLDEIEDLETRLELPFSLKISQKPVSKCQFYIKL